MFTNKCWQRVATFMFDVEQRNAISRFIHSILLCKDLIDFLEDQCARSTCMF